MNRDLFSLGRAIENLCTVEMRPPGGNQGLLDAMVEMARSKQGGPPMMVAAERLAAAFKAGDVAVIATGFYLPGVFPKGETDGPPGAASLAYALSRGLGAVPLVLAEEEQLDPVRASLNAIGLTEHSLEAAKRTPMSYALGCFSTDADSEAQANQRADELLTSVRPKAVITIEKSGLNSKGIPHRMRGSAITGGGRMRIETLTGRAREAGVLTIAVGDRGNEAGIGLVAEAIRQYADFGAKCVCPCQAGIAVVDEVDVTVIGAISNWGCYGIAAALGIVTGKEDTVHAGETEVKVIEACNHAGAVDGVYEDTRLCVDGVPAQVHGQLVDMLRVIVGIGLGREWS